MDRSRRYLILLIVLVAAAFAASVTGGHLQLDDWGYIYGCPFVADGLSWKGLVAAFADYGHGGIWMPLTYLSYALDISLFGRGWAAHHAVNVALHAANAVLLFACLRALLIRLAPERAERAAFAAFAGALLWALHPQRAEAVAWVASRKEELWTLFALFACAAWTRFLDLRSFGTWLAAFVALLLASFAKPTAVVVPVLFVLLARFLRAQRVRLAAYLPFFAVALATGLVALASQTHPTDAEQVALFDTRFSWRLLNGAVSAGLDLLHTFWPVGLHLDYRAVPNGFPLDGVAGLVALAVALAVPLCLFRRPRAMRTAYFALAWYLLALLPVLGILGFTGDKAYADRYTYLPSLAFAFLVSVLCLRWGQTPKFSKFRWGQTLLFMFVAAELALLIPLERSFAYDDLAWGRVLVRDRDHWRALRIVGCEKCAHGEMDAGVAMLVKSLKRHASRRTAESLAYVLAQRGKPGDYDAVRHLGAAVEKCPAADAGGMMSDALGVVALKEGRAADAVRFFSASLAAPGRMHRRDNTFLNLGLALQAAGREDEARPVLEKAAASPLADVSARARSALGTR